MIRVYIAPKFLQGFADAKTSCENCNTVLHVGVSFFRRLQGFLPPWRTRGQTDITPYNSGVSVSFSIICQSLSVFFLFFYHPSRPTREYKAQRLLHVEAYDSLVSTPQRYPSDTCCVPRILASGVQAPKMHLGFGEKSPPRSFQVQTHRLRSQDLQKSDMSP